MDMLRKFFFYFLPHLKLSILQPFLTSSSVFTIKCLVLEKNLVLIQSFLEHCSVLFQLFRQKEQLGIVTHRAGAHRECPF